MKIIAVTGSWPPHHSEACELRSRDILGHLVQRGHQIILLTTKCPEKRCELHKQESGILRQLHRENPSKGLVEQILFDYEDVRRIHNAVTLFEPDLIYLFHVTNVTRAMYPYLADCNIPIVLDEGGKGYPGPYWHRGAWYQFVEYESGSPIRNMIKSMLTLLISHLSGNLLKRQWKWPEGIRVYFDSELVRQSAQNAGLDVGECPVINARIDVRQFPYRRIIHEARKSIQESHTVDAYIDKIESFLWQAVNGFYSKI